MGRDGSPAGSRLSRGRQAARRFAARVVQGDLDALEQRLVREIQAAGRKSDARDTEIDAASRQAVEGLTARVHELERTLRELGGAMSREHGLPGAAGAYREAQYLLHELRRDLRAHTVGHPPAGPPAGPPPAGPSPAAPAPAPADLAEAVVAGVGTGPAVDPYAGKHPRLFDYAGFERRFRGDPDDVRRALGDRYLPLLESTLVAEGAGNEARGPVVDIGCGRGELLEVLQARGFEVVGVEPEAALAAQARERGVPVVETLGADWLRGVADGSLGAVVSFHVVEHLVVDDLIELLQLAARKLRPGGLFVAETPNPMTVLTLHESYLMDPTHVQPLHPALLSWLAETAGFRAVEVAYHAPASSLWIPPLEGDGPLVEQLDRAFGQLNHQLYGPQDYSLVARA